MGTWQADTLVRLITGLVDMYFTQRQQAHRIVRNHAVRMHGCCAFIHGPQHAHDAASQEATTATHLFLPALEVYMLLVCCCR